MRLTADSRHYVHLSTACLGCVVCSNSSDVRSMNVCQKVLLLSVSEYRNEALFVDGNDQKETNVLCYLELHSNILCIRNPHYAEVKIYCSGSLCVERKLVMTNTTR